jgi:tetratricopeptide (TPR) repeat protein
MSPPFWNKGSSAKPPEPQRPDAPANRVDKLANELHRGGRASELEAELRRLDYSALSPPEQESWWHLYGITAFRDGHEVEALRRFEEAHEKFPNSASIRFSLGQQYVRTGDAERGFQLFRTSVFPRVSREFALAQARYAYLFDRYAHGMAFIEPFFDAYKKLRVLDTTFLWIRGLPFFETAWDYLATFSILSGELSELEATTRWAIDNCHDYNLDQLQALLKSGRDDSHEDLLKYREKLLDHRPSGNFPTGYTRMGIAVIHARTANSLQAAQAILEGVTLSTQDFAWLGDVRTLAIAQAAERFGSRELEREKLGEFLKRQPMLFEPNIALEFCFLRYQQSLKPNVRESLRNAAVKDGQA